MMASSAIAGRPLSPWLRLARLGVIAFAIGVLVLSAAGVVLFPGYAGEHAREFTPNAFWTAEQAQAALVADGLPAATIAWYAFASDVMLLLVQGAFALFLLWRKSDDWLGLYAAFTFLSTSAGSAILAPVLVRSPGLAAAHDVFGAVSWELGFILFYVFPDGRFVPRWSRWMPLVWLAASFVQWTSAVWVGMGLVATAIGGQVYRYGWRSTPLQRQQTKWVVAVLAAMFLVLFPAMFTVFRPPPAEALGPALVWALLGGFLFRVSFLFIPAAILIAIMRYHLWDIDLIIRRTLVYSILTALLALAYFGSVVLLQQLLRGLVGPSSELAIAVSTLAIWALFSPLRRRVQDLIDRRFYRRKYDAAETLAAFGRTASDETDLDRLAGRLVEVVDETMQPEHRSLWLKPPVAGGARGTHA